MTILLLMILLMMMIVYYDDDDDGDVDMSDEYDDGDHDTCDVKYNPDVNNSIITVLHIHKCEIKFLLIV
jgi:hypothetical protein